MKRIFGIYAIGLLALWITLSFSCGQRNLQSTDAALPTIELTVKELTQQDVYPGVHSNLSKTRNYVLKAEVDLSSEMKLGALLVDSIKLKPNYVSIDGIHQRGSEFLIAPGNHEIQVNFAWNFYGNGPKMVTETIPEASGMVVDKGQAKLEVWIQDEIQVLDLGKITVLESIYAP